MYLGYNYNIMATVSGVPVQNITGISGADATSITSINGVSTSTIPGWPGGSGPSCTTVFYGYSDGRRQPPSEACFAEPQPYDFDEINNLLYLDGGCQNDFATPGFYANNGIIYFWDGASLTPTGEECR